MKIDFEYLSQFPKIMVSGPQRSGTRLMSRHLSESLGIGLIYEEHYNFIDESLFFKCANFKEDAVIQAPGMSHLMHVLGEYDHVAVILMRRDLSEIYKSEDKIGWRTYREGINPRSQYILYRNLVEYYRPGSTTADMKYQVFDNFQKDKILNLLEVPFEYLKSTDLWVEKEVSKNFWWCQTSEDDPIKR